MKKFSLFITLLFSAFYGKAQEGFNFYNLGIGLGTSISYEKATTGIPKQNSHLAFSGSVVNSVTPYFQVIVEAQLGKLSGGGLTADQDPLGREYINKYQAFFLHVDLQLGEVIKYDDSWVLNVAKNFYLGSGIGFIRNNVTAQRTNIIPSNGSLNYVFPGTNKSTNFLIPTRIGYDLKIFDKYNETSISIDLGYGENFVLGNGLDGYYDPSAKSGNSQVDRYRQFIIGIKLYAGRVHSYRKRITALKAEN